MKKIFAILMAATLCLIGQALAEGEAIEGEWQVNDNIMAGMTIEKKAGDGWDLQINTVGPTGAYVLKADLFYDGDLEEYVYEDGTFYQSAVTAEPVAEIGDVAAEGASGSLTLTQGPEGDARLIWHNALSPDEDAVFCRPEGWGATGPEACAGHTFAGKDPWGGDLRVEVPFVGEGKACFIITEDFYGQTLYEELWDLDLDDDDAARFRLEGFVLESDNTRCDYEGTIQLGDREITVTYESGQMTEESPEGGSTAYHVEALDEADRAVTLAMVD